MYDKFNIVYIPFCYEFIHNERNIYLSQQQFQTKPQNKITNKELELHEFLKTQKGSRIYQRRLKKMNNIEIVNLIKTLNEHFSEIICNNYGNYFCQKLYSICDLECRLLILNIVNYI